MWLVVALAALGSLRVCEKPRAALLKIQTPHSVHQEGREKKIHLFSLMHKPGGSSLAKSDTTLSYSFQLLQEANEQTRASFNPSPLWELDL